MPISKDKVLIVYNLDEPLSLQVADYYIAARGLTPHKLGLPLGNQTTSNHPTATFEQVLQVADYMVTNAIEAVICSAKCPVGVDCQPGIEDGTRLFENVLGGAKRWRAEVLQYPEKFSGKTFSQIGGIVSKTGHTNGGVNGDVILEYLEFGYNYDGLGVFPTQFKRYFKKTFNWQRNPSWVPHGRIGVPKYNNLFPEETFESSIRFVNDALANEGSYVTHANKPVHYHYYDAYGGVYSGTGSTEMARRIGESAGLGQKICVYYTCNPDWYPLIPSHFDYSHEDYEQGLIQLPLWAMLGGYANGGMFTHGIGSPIQNDFQLLPGSWGMGGMSNCLLGPGSIFLNRGAVAWSGNTYEPYVEALLCPEAFMSSVVQGLSMMEAASHSNMQDGWMQGTWGDPLYAPFGKQNVTLVG